MPPYKLQLLPNQDTGSLCLVEDAEGTNSTASNQKIKRRKVVKGEEEHSIRPWEYVARLLLVKPNMTQDESCFDNDQGKILWFQQQCKPCPCRMIFTLSLGYLRRMRLGSFPASHFRYLSTLARPRVRGRTPEGTPNPGLYAYLYFLCGHFYVLALLDCRLELVSIQWPDRHPRLSPRYVGR